MATARSITLNYLDRFKKDIESCIYSIDKDIEPELYKGVADEIQAIKTTIQIINELEVE